MKPVLNGLFMKIRKLQLYDIQLYNW